MIATHNIEVVYFTLSKKFKVSKKLELANEVQVNFFKISPSDYEIHWPLLDEDLSIDLMLKVKQS